MKNHYKILFFITLIFLCIASTLPLRADYDLWARLIAGMSVVESGVVLKQDIFSYTPVHAWIDHEWGASVVIYLFAKAAEFFGVAKIYTLAVLQVLLTFLIYLSIFFTLQLKSDKKYSEYSIILFLFVIFASNAVFASTVRCHLFSFLFFTVWLFLLEYYRITGKKLPLAILPIIMLFWGNIHGGCLSGLGILAIYAIGECLNKKNPLPYLITLLFSFGVLFINPYGAEYVKFLFFAGTMARKYISEWQPTFSLGLQTIKFQIYFVLISIVILTNVIKNKANFVFADKTKLLLIVSTAAVALLHAKLIPFFVITSSIFLYEEILALLGKIKFFRTANAPENKFTYAVILLFCLLNINSYKYEISNNDYPYDAVNFIKANEIKGNLFVDMTYGSYCAYKLFPQNKIFMDGRYEEVYAPSLLLEIRDFLRQEPLNSESVLRKYETQIVLLKKYNSFQKMKVVDFLNKNKWRNIYEDNFWLVFISPEYPLNNNFQPINLKFKKENLFDTDINKVMLKTL